LVGFALDEHELERGLGGGEVDVAGAPLRRLDPEQRPASIPTQPINRLRTG
jgi:hypothetical protein